MQSDDLKGSYSAVISTHLESIFNTVIDGVVIIDKKGVMQATNPAITRLFGYSADELAGENVSILMPSPHNKKHDGYIDEYLDTGHKKVVGIGREVEGLKKDGSLFPFRLTISESVIDNEKYFTGIVHDITEIKQAQEDMNLVNKQLEKIVSQRTNQLTNSVNKLLDVNTQLTTEIALREKTEQDLATALEKEKELGVLKSQFVTMASHEFRTPLSTILSSANIISRYKTANEQGKREKHVRKISSSVKNMTNILEDILSLGRLEEGKIENQPEAFELMDFVEHVTEKLNTILKAGQKIDMISDSKVINVMWPKNFTENILNNLLSNAIKYSNEESTVVIELTEEKENILIKITDEGIGIPAGQQKHLFERFFRAANALNIKGTGLGLHIVNEYVNLMHGEIEFESEQGKGSEFSVRLPIK